MAIQRTTHFARLGQLTLIVFGLMSIRSPAFADEPAEREATRLLRWLGSPEFRDREAAEAKLLKLGTKAKPEVLTGAQSPDAEVAKRCVAILNQLRMTVRKAFIAGDGDWSGHLGKRFKELVGDSVESRSLFAEMTADEHRERLLESTTNPNETARLYVYKLELVERAGSDVFEAFTGGLAEPEIWAKYRDAHKDAVPLGELAAILFLGSTSLPESVRDPAQVQQLLKITFVEAAKGPFKEPLRKLFVAWLEQRREPEAVAAGLNASLYGSIPDAAPFARRLIREPRTPPAVIGAALEVIGNHGSKADDLPRLAKFRNDARQVQQLAGAKEGEFELQIRDLAAAMSIRMCSKNIGCEFRWTSWVGHWFGPDRPPFESIQPFHKSVHRERAIYSAWDWLDSLPKDGTNG